MAVLATKGLTVDMCVYGQCIVGYEQSVIQPCEEG